MSFHQKSAWVCLISILLLFAPYFLLVFQFPMAFIGLLPLAAIVLSVLLAIFHIVTALATRSVRKAGDVPSPDEFEKMIELKAAKISGFVLAFAVATWCFIAMFSVPVIGIGARIESKPLQIPVDQALTAIQVLFASFVIANLVYYGSIIAGYPRPVNG